MAAEETLNVGEHEKLAENEDYDPKLDFYSEQFDPLLALRTPNVRVPVPDAKIYDNIYKYKSTYEGKSQPQQNKAKTKEIPHEAPVERRWLPHQLPTKRERKVTQKNVLTRMETVVGPLEFLKICKDKRHRIKVWTRHSHDIRGYCVAYLVAFDKHWNLALEDVEEVWSRAKRRKIPALENAKSSFNIRPKVLPPTVTIIKSTKTTETCSRHVNQLLIRGEHVAYIVLVADEKKQRDNVNLKQ